MRRLATALVTAALLTGSAAAETFKDWQVDCDAAHRCQAVGLADGTGARGYLTLHRRHADTGSAELRFWVADPDGAIAGRPYFVQADGKPLGSLGGPVIFGSPEEEGGLVQARLPPEATARLAEVLRRYRSLQLRASDGSVAVNASLAGAAASWLYMEDRLVGEDPKGGKPAT